METVREFRVETNAYGAEFGRTCRRPDQRPDQVRHQPLQRQRLRVSTATTRSTRATTSTRWASPTSRAISSAGRIGGPLIAGPAVLLRRLRGAHRAAGQDDLDGRARRQRAAGHPSERRRSASTRPSRPTSPSSRARTGHRSVRGWRSTTSRSISASTSTSPRAVSTTAPAPRQFFARYTFDDTEAVPADGLSAVSAHLRVAQPVLHWRVPRGALGRDVEHGASQLQPHAHRPGTSRRTPHSRSRRSCPAGRSWATSTSAASSASVRRARSTCGWCRTCSASRTTSCTRAGVTCIKAGALVEHYQDNMVNPTFSLGIYAFPNLSAFLRNVPNNFVGLTPEAQFDRYWRFTLFGFYAQDEYRLTPQAERERGTALRVHDDARGYLRPRFVAAGPDGVAADGRTAVREPDLHEPLAARGLRVGRLRRRQDVACAAVTASTSTRRTSRT